MNQPLVPKSFRGPSVQAAFDRFMESLAENAQLHFAGDLHGKLVLAVGLAGNEAIQPLVATRQGAAFLGIEPNPEQIKLALRAGYCEIMVNSLDEALRILKNAVRRREPASVGLVGDCAPVLSELAARGVVPDIILLGSSEPAKSPALIELRRLGSILLALGVRGAGK